MTKTALRILLLASVGLLASTAHAETVVIEGAMVRTPKRTFDEVNLVIKNGKVVAMSQGAKIPAEARVIAGKGLVVTAGLVATDTRLGLVEIGAVSHTREGAFGSEHPVHASYSVIDGYNPASMVIDVARNAGITSSISAPSGGLVAGQSAWLSLDDEGDASRNTLKPVTAMHVALGRFSMNTGDGSRGHALAELRALFDDALHYSKNKAAYDRGQTRPYRASQQDLQALGAVVQGRVPVVVRVDRESDIAAVLRLAKDYRLKLVIEGGAESWRLAKELAAAKVPVIVNPKDNLPTSFDETQVVNDLATRLAKAGVTVILSPSYDASSARTLRQLAGLAVAHGLAWEEALAAITENPAKVFGVDRGELRVGAVADLVVWNGDPLQLSSRPLHIFIGGKEQPMDNHQTRLLERYRELPARLR